MNELTVSEASEAAGGLALWTILIGLTGGSSSPFGAYMSGIGAMGATLSNYYGQDRALEIVAAGNMGA